ncbi:MAG: phenylacetate--CoA ligase, partial [Betaproteobacteria bacterium]|nr:phenylacetate--CoA ligase [Betaproteobacteria bacterium]
MIVGLKGNYFNPGIETAPREDIRRIQLEKLRQQAIWAFERVLWYRERFLELGVRPEDIRSLEDVRRLPFTDKQALRDTYPFGMCAIPLDDVVRLHSSSGTTGKPIVIGYSRRDLDVWSDCVARLAAMAGVTRADRVQMAFGYGMFTGGFGLHYGCEKLGC